MIGSILPRNLKDYKSLNQDIIAGLTVAVMIIPQGMAYALLAGLPAIYGLYAAFIPLFIYPLFGTSRQLSVGPVALVSIIVLAGISQWADPNTARYIELALLTSLVAGIIQVLLSIGKMGFLVNFLSEPVIVGFTTAAAIIIGLSQLKYLFGIDIGNSNDVLGLMQGLVENIEATNFISLAIGIVAILLMVLSKKSKRNIPGAIIVVIIGTLLVYFFNLDKHNLQIVGTVPDGLPALNLSFINIKDIILVTPLALVICLISFIESLAIAKTIAKKHDNYPIDANNELLGLGMSKIIGSIFQAFPNTGSFTRSAINDEAGAVTGISSFVSGIFIGLILLFFTPLFFFLPKAVLGAIVISAVFGLINIPYVTQLFYISKKDFGVFFVTFILTLLLGIQEGVFIGIILSLLLIIKQASKPHFAILGKLPGTSTYRNVERYEEAEIQKGVAIIRYDESIYFANANHFIETINDIVANQKDLNTVILNCAAINNLDSTGLSKMNELLESLALKDIKLIFTELRGPIRDLFVKSGVTDKIGYENNYLTIQDAIDEHISRNGISNMSRKYASQINKRKKTK
ncbi:MAG: sulfate permease [Saprospiraceae bacterium]